MKKKDKSLCFFSIPKHKVSITPSLHHTPTHSTTMNRASSTSRASSSSSGEESPRTPFSLIRPPNSNDSQNRQSSAQATASPQTTAYARAPSRGRFDKLRQQTSPVEWRVSSKENEVGLTALANLQAELLRLQTQKTYASTTASQRLSELLRGIATRKGQAPSVYSDQDPLSDRKYKSLCRKITRLDNLIAEVETRLKDLDFFSLRVLLFKKPHVARTTSTTYIHLPLMIPDPERLQWHKRCIRNNGPRRSRPSTRYHHHQTLLSPGIEDGSQSHSDPVSQDL